LEDIMRATVPARLLLAALVCLVAACGGSGDDTTGAAATTTSSTTTTTTAGGTTAAASQACADAAALKASLAELDQLDPAQAGKAGIQAALEKVQANLAALRGSAAGQWGSQISELDAAMQALKTTIDGVDGNSLLSAVPTIVSDLKRIDTAWNGVAAADRPGLRLDDPGLCLTYSQQRLEPGNRDGDLLRQLEPGVAGGGGAVGIFRHGGPLLVERLGGYPTPTTRQPTGDRHLNLHENPGQPLTAAARSVDGVTARGVILLGRA
jgi:hypothetical protein